MNKKNLIFGIVGSIILTGALIGTSVGIYYAVKNQKSDSAPIDSNVPNISEANTQYTSNYQNIYNLSTPVMFIYQSGTSIGFQNGTAWVFDKSQNEIDGLVTYYLATNLHVINLWSGANDTVNTNAISNVGLCIGKPKQEFNSDNMTSNDVSNFKWKYISTNSENVNLSEWYISKTLHNWNTLPDQSGATSSNLNIAQPNPLSFKYEKRNDYWPDNGQYTYWLYPELGLLEDADIGIIKIQMNQDNVQNFPFLQTFDNLIATKGIEGIYDFDSKGSQTFSASIGGFPVMQDDNWNYSVWNSWESTNSQSDANIVYGNSGRGSIQYQGIFTNPINQESPSPYYGIANEANLHHGSSGSMVINNTTNKIEGIYWGGLQIGENNFSGRFVPFAQNGILETWAKLIGTENNIDILGNTYVYQYYLSNSNNQPLPSSWNNLFMINPFLSKYLPFIISKWQ